MINEIKTIVKNYLNSIKLTSLMLGTVTSKGVKINDRLILPNELITGNLKEYITEGDKVKLLRNHGGDEFYIVEIINKQCLLKGKSIILTRNGEQYKYLVEGIEK